MIYPQNTVDKLIGQFCEQEYKVGSPYNVYYKNFSPINVLTFEDRFYLENLLKGQPGYMCVSGTSYGINGNMIFYLCMFTGLAPIIGSRQLIYDVIKAEAFREASQKKK